MAVKQPRAQLADHVTITRRYVRSVDMVRDLPDRGALEGYVATPPVRDALRRLLHGLRPDSTQRAFRITGPYGSGKSAFGLLLARVMIERATRRGAAFNVLKAASLDRAGADLPPYVPLVLNGRHGPFAEALLDALYAAASGTNGAVPSRALARDALRARSRSSDSVYTLDLIAKYAERVAAARRGAGGVAVFVDEMGRFLEYAALNRVNEDVSIFQQLAELAAGAAAAPVAAIAFLHHRFADYAAGFGAFAEAEWTRSAERYEDIPLLESTEEATFLVAQALSHSRASIATSAPTARKLYTQAVRRGVFGPHAQLAEVAPRLFPLHPATAACLAQFARRFGQYGRSIFSFLQSLEPFGLQRFMQAAPLEAASWYRLPVLFDYLAGQPAVRPGTADRERRWNLVLDAVRQSGDVPSDDLAVLKCVGVLAALEPVPGLKADVDTLSWCTGSSTSAVDHALARLVKRGVLYCRAHRDDYSPWASTSVDLDQWLEEAHVRNPPVRRLDTILENLPPARPLVAHRHYHRSGTLRAFAVRVWNRTGPFELPVTEGEYDGAVVVVAAYPDERFDDVVTSVATTSAAADERTLFCVRRITPADLTCAQELAMWQWIQRECAELRSDDLARREVRDRLVAAELALLAVLRPFSATVDGDTAAATWLHRGHVRQFSRAADVSAYLSDICDAAYASGPILKNELINRASLSSAAASARMRLLERMADDASREYLGLVGAPPERTMYLSVFHASRMHRELAPGTWGFAPPAPDPYHWQPTWQALEAFLSAHEICRFDELLTYLREPPYGLRAGPALLLVAAFMLHRPERIALMERGSFVPAVTGAHFMRLAKNPAQFALRYMPEEAATRALLHALATRLVLWRNGEHPSAAVKPITEALYRWWNDLPEYARANARVSPKADAVRTVLRKASDPIRLLCHDLPTACGLAPVPLDRVRANELNTLLTALNAALQELADATPQLRRGAEAAVLQAFAVESVASLREQLRREHGPHHAQLADFRLRAFVERAVMDTPDDKWLDSVASLVVGKRIDAWNATVLDEFAFEIRAIARQLTRWLALAQASAAAPVPLAAPVVAIHVVDIAGREDTLLVHSAVSRSAHDRLRQIRELLSGRADARELLGRLLIEYATAETEQEYLANE